MRKLGKLVAIIAAVMIVFVVITPSGPVVKRSALTDEFDALRRMGIKIAVYENERTPDQPAILPTTTIDELVTMHVLAPTDADYLRERLVVFRGYDRKSNGGESPMFEAPFPPRAPRHRIVVNSDISGSIGPAEDHRK